MGSMEKNVFAKHFVKHSKRETKLSLDLLLVKLCELSLGEHNKFYINLKQSFEKKKVELHIVS